MAKITLNDQDYDVTDGITVLQAARQVGVEIPVFCYHDSLSIAGNCRMCLVEIGGAPKPMASCALPITEGMMIKTNSDMVRKAQKGVLEFLLINHPLDCPICDQGGECDLQDVTMAYGPSTSRFKDNKRAVENKNMGPLIKTMMNRCIHCTRCVRFATEIAGVPELGAIGRGENVEITPYLDHMVTHELSANVIDLCPVGALTSKPYAFKGRSWELQKTPSIDVMDAMGSHIRIDTHRMKVKRILPRPFDAINGEWLSNKSRYSCDGLAQQRLDQPYVKKNNTWTPVSWENAFHEIQQSLTKHKELAAIAGPLVDCESTLVLKDILTSLKCTHFECRPEGVYIDTRTRGAYTFNSTIAGIDHADVALLIGTDLRREAPLLAARLRQRYLTGDLKVAYMGPDLKENDLTHAYHDLGNTVTVLDDLMNNTHSFSPILSSANYPLIIVGETALKGEQGLFILNKIHNLLQTFKGIQPHWNGYNFLAQSAGLVGALDMGFISHATHNSLEDIYAKVEAGHITWVYLHGADDLDFDRLKKAFKVYQGHHGDKGAMHADVILPGAAYTEKEATYTNIEGRVQRTYAALNPPGMAKNDVTLLFELARHLNIDLPYSNVEGIRQKMAAHHKAYEHVGTLQFHSLEALGLQGSITRPSFEPYEQENYMTNSISRHSQIMAQCEKIHGGLNHDK